MWIGPAPAHLLTVAPSPTPSARSVAFPRPAPPPRPSPFPHCRRHSQELGAIYTLVCLDPDAPSRDSPTAGLLNHWLVPNLAHSPFGTGATPLDKPSPAYVPYAGPSLKKEEHRLAFLLYRQEGRLKGLGKQGRVKEVVEVADR